MSAGVNASCYLAKGDDLVETFLRPGGLFVLPAVVDKFPIAIDGEAHRQMPDAPVAGHVRIAEPGCQCF